MVKIFTSFKLRILLVSLILLGLFLVPIQLSYAQMPYWVMAYDESAVYGSPRIGEARGNTGLGYVMNNPISIKDDHHVNPLYVSRDAWYDSNFDDFVEAGWVYEYGWPDPYAMANYQTNREEETLRLIRRLTRGEYYAFKVAVVTGTTTWVWIIDNVQYGNFNVTLPFGRGTPIAGSEKLMRNGNNYANWDRMKLKRSQGDYRNWLDLRRYGGDTDPYYHLREISNIKFYVVHD